MLDVLTADAAKKHHEHSLLHHHHHHHTHSHSHHGDEHGEQANGSFFALSILGSVLRRASPSPSPAPALEPEPSPPMTTHPSTPITSPAHSRPASVSSVASAGERPKKRAPRPKTTYNLAQPPPFTGPRHKLHLRPKVLLQLHQVIPGRRPKPVYEVIPFSLLAPRSTRRLARTFNSKERLGPGDLLIVKAEDYDHTPDDEKTDDERWGTREVIGIICPSKKGDKDPSDKAEVLMDDGTSWDVTNMANGGYEFSYTDEHGLTLKRRWVIKPPHSRRTSGMSNASQPLGSPGFGPEERRFRFSTISPHSRRHPVIASLSRSSIDVQDSYVIPSVTTPPTPGGRASPLPSPANISSLQDMTSFMDKEALSVKTDDALRRFIVLSGIWVAFSENWSQVYTTTKTINCPYGLSTPTASRPGVNRAVSMSFLDSPRSSSPGSMDECTRGKTKLFRSGTMKSAVNGSLSPASTPATTSTSPASPLPLKTRSRRAKSTGAADLGPPSSTRKRFGIPFEEVAETEEERQTKRSEEVLRIKTQLTYNPPIVSDTPIPIINAPALDPASPPSPDHRARKTQSAYNPITTAGLWDSSVVDGPDKKRPRPTSMLVGKLKEKDKEKDKEKQKAKPPGQKKGFRKRFLNIFSRREKTGL